MANEAIRVLVADDHALFREMLVHTLAEEEGIRVVGEAVDGLEAIQMCKELSPDIILLDIEMPKISGIEATVVIVRECPKTRVVILTAYDDDHYVFQLVQAGATGYILKDSHSSEVIGAVRAAASGEALIQPRIAHKILKEFSRMRRQEPPQTSAEKLKALEGLTDRETQVLRLIAQGSNNKEISALLFISEPTVKTHVSNLMHKLSLRDRVDIVLFAMQAGLVHDQPGD